MKNVVTVDEFDLNKYFSRQLDEKIHNIEHMIKTFRKVFKFNIENGERNFFSLSDVEIVKSIFSFYNDYILYNVWFVNEEVNRYICLLKEELKLIAMISHPNSVHILLIEEQQCKCTNIFQNIVKNIGENFYEEQKLSNKIKLKRKSTFNSEIDNKKMKL